VRWILILLFCGCSPKYEVVGELYPNTYHTVGVRDKEVVLYKTPEKLKEGQIIRIPNKLK
tara:strand:- start:181 stop:360 length:180 start_codon:yes stop_codon:yes gene_type:complete